MYNCIDANGCFASLTITNNQFALATANWNHCINCLNTSLHRFFYSFPITNNLFALATTNSNHCLDCLNTSLQTFIYRFTVNHTRSLTLQWHFITFPAYRTTSINRLSQGVYYAAYHSLTNFYRCN